MHKKKHCSLSDVSVSAENKLFVDVELPDWRPAKNIRFSRCIFVRVGLKGATLDKLTFHRCVFLDCYLRKVTLHNVDFTGSVFRDCNLERARMDSCNFRYVRFRRCLLNYDEILNSLPTGPNLAIGLLRSIRSNAAEMGNNEIVDKIISEEVATEIKELSNRVRGVTEYYREHYKPAERLFSLIRLVRLVLSGVFWGHGLRIAKLLRSAIFLILGFACLYQYFGVFIEANEVVQNNFAVSLYLSTVTFTTLGHQVYCPGSVLTYILCASESILGVVYLGFFVAALYRRLSR